jgi:drug/metabolite transporter (DMT)-like permease
VKLSRNQGIVLALGAAIVSGISIYINKFGVAQVSDPFIYTTVKNSVVVVGLLAAVGLLASWKELRDLTPARWLAWIGLGVIGGGFLSSCSSRGCLLLPRRAPHFFKRLSFSGWLCSRYHFSGSSWGCGRC